MHTRADDGGRDTRGKIAVTDELDARAGLANVGDELLVAWTIEDDDDEVIHTALEAACDVLQVVRDGGVEIDGMLAGWADDDFVHVAIGRVEQATLFGSGQHGDGAGSARSAEISAFEGIDGDVDFGDLAAVGKCGADLLADVEHG